ncbi:iron uptake system protein EfeO [Pseudomonas typographi]|uniref:Iron uptake system protein EfeO n=1 Tax=Pseudomonas typographi TaxID=2715964 RepID=A0ABR7Z6W2_9PSED|nr:iron uptake system protein EfeO [Pseudomonas typographi]MBD1601261.1 iron uptake system protein EfeO [Pseudomonas typographi]
MSNPTQQPPRLLRAAVAGSVILMIAAGGLFYYASQVASEKRKANAGNEITVTIHPKSCEPNALTLPAGRASFRIVNASDRAVEWEILDGVLVVEERENITPGMSQLINANLEPGDYAITCGLLSNPRGTLKVTPTAESDARAKARPAMTAFIGPLSEYRVYLNTQGGALVQAVDELAAAIQAGDLAQARALYAAARVPYQRLAPAAQRFAQLNNAVDARADYYEKREQDPAFTGFHRLEYGLFAQNSTDGLAPVAQQLQADVATLKAQLLAQPIPPDQLVNIVARNLHTLADTRYNGEQERYSHLDLSGFAANLEGTGKVIDLLRPLLAKSAAKLLPQIDTAQQKLAGRLAGLREGDTYKPYDQVNDEQRKAIASDARALADTLDGIDQALGLSAL